MKRLSITRGFLVIIIVISIFVGAAFAFILINPNVLGLISSGERITISTDDYNQLVNNYNKYRKLDTIRKHLNQDFYIDVDDAKLDDAMIKGMVSGLDDVYSSYYSADEYEEIMISMVGEYSGVGITMVQQEDGIQVLNVTHDSPAEKGGVTIGEYIIAVDGVEYPVTEMDSCAAAIRGKEGTSVTITFFNGKERIDRSFKRKTIQVDSVDSEMLDDNIGYIWLYGFEKGSYDDFKEALSSLSSADALIIDLRDNPGGLVEAAQNIADLFLDKATLFYTEDHDKAREYFYSSDGTMWDKPVVLIINENSASSSEIFAAALQDNDRVKIVGETSFGKGVIQSLESFEDGSALKLTMWQYFAPDGSAIHKIGITPDYVVEMTEDCYDENGALIDDIQLKKAVELIKQEIN